jgi:hypothetical protein
MDNRQMVIYSTALLIAGICLGALCVVVPLAIW